MSARRLLLTVSAVAAVLLGLEKVGVVDVLPKGNVRFESSAAAAGPAAQRLAMRSDVGDVTGWLELVLPYDAADAGSYSASLAGGDVLAVTATVLSPVRLHLAVSKAPSPPIGTPFTWRTGIPIVLSHTGALAHPLTLDDWVVHQSGQPDDSSGRAWWRRVWTIASWGLLLLSIAGVALNAWTEKSEPAATPMLLVRSIVGSIEGKTPVETKKLRGFLSLVLLDGVTVNEALDKLEVPSHPVYARAAFQARAAHLFRSRIQLVKADLDAFVDRLP